jgi:prenyl protein peptidase
MACVASTVFVLILIALKGNGTSLPEALKLLGWWPIGIVEIIKSLLLTAILFSGPLFERGVAEDGWRSWIRGEGLSETLRSWIGFRNYVAVCPFYPSLCALLLMILRALSRKKSSSALSLSRFTY